MHLQNSMFRTKCHVYIRHIIADKPVITSSFFSNLINSDNQNLHFPTANMAGINSTTRSVRIVITGQCQQSVSSPTKWIHIEMSVDQVLFYLHKNEKSIIEENHILKLNSKKLINLKSGIILNIRIKFKLNYGRFNKIIFNYIIVFRFLLQYYNAKHDHFVYNIY